MNETTQEKQMGILAGLAPAEVADASVMTAYATDAANQPGVYGAEDASVAEFRAQTGDMTGLEGVTVNEAVASAEVAQVDAKSGWLNKLSLTLEEKYSNVSARAKRAVALGVSGLAIGSFGVATASAETTNAKPTVTTTTTLEIGIAGSKQKVSSSSEARVVSNYRTVSRAEIARAKKKGDCETISGKEAMKRGIKTQGYNGSGKGFEYENRRSTLCDIDGDGDIDVRAECGNAAKGGVANVVKAKATTWVKNAASAVVSVKANAVAKAVAVCKTTNTYAAAYGTGEASGSAKAKAKIFNRVKGTLKSLISTASAGASGKASAKASAEAVAVCVETGGTVVSIQEVPVTPVPPKDGTQGPGTTVPTQPGGTGAGGQPGNTTPTGETGVACRDTNDTANGDGNPATQGGLLYGTAVDQFGYCVGPAKPLQ